MLVKKRMAYDTIRQVKTCNNYKACKTQIGGPFGVIPLSPLVVYTWPKTSNATVSDPLKAHIMIETQGVQIFWVGVFQ